MTTPRVESFRNENGLWLSAYTLNGRMVSDACVGESQQQSEGKLRDMFPLYNYTTVQTTELRGNEQG